MSGRRDLVIGADGLIGAALVSHLKRLARPVLGTSRRGQSENVPLDLAGVDKSWSPPKDIGRAFICAAMTSQAECEAMPERARAVNVEAPVHLARVLRDQGAKVIFLSSGVVFNGTTPWMKTTDAPAPLNAYGRMKMQAEEALRQINGTVIVRLTKVLDPHTVLFTRWIDALRLQQPIHPFHDMFFCPLSVEFVAFRLARLNTEDAIVHFSGTHDISYADAARHIAERLAVPQGLVQPISRRSKGIPDIMAPSFTSLATSCLMGDPPEPYDVLDEVYSLGGRSV